ETTDAEAPEADVAVASEAAVTADATPEPAPEAQDEPAEPEATAATEAPADATEPEAATDAEPAPAETTDAEAPEADAATDADDASAPEAETATESEPAPAPAPAAPATPEAQPQPQPPTDLPPHLLDAHRAAGKALAAEGLEGTRAKVYLVVDRSGSMRGYFKDGSVQRLAEQAVALAAHLDEDATVTTVFFSTDIDGVVDVTPADLTPTRVEEINAGLGRLGRTNYHRAVEEVLAHHEKADPARPALVIFQTDGAPESRTAANQALAEAAGRPVHWRFTAWGEADGKAFDYLRKLTADRTATHFAGPAPAETPHEEFYRGVLTGLKP
ncbi:VWA domain-containing protein, partial [Streptomyces sp. NPDC057866]